MPDSIRTWNGGRQAYPLRGRLLASIVFFLVAVLAPTTGWADADGLVFDNVDRQGLAALALLLGAVVFAVVTAVLLVRTRHRAHASEAASREAIARLKVEFDRARTLLLAEPQIVVSWAPGEDEPEIAGDPARVLSSPDARHALAFGTWLEPDKAQAMDHAVDRLRGRGECFAMSLTTLSGRHLEAEGRPIGGRAVLRLREVSGATRELAELMLRHQNLLRDVDALRTLIETLPAPIWARDASGRLVWVNDAYAQAVEARGGHDAIARGMELLDSTARGAQQSAHASGKTYAARIPVIVAGQRRMFDVLDLPTREGSAGIGIDVTEVETMRAEVTRMVNAHRRTLDQLPTAVAIFGADRRLAFYNAAYRILWGLGPDLLDDSPTDSQVLDHLRAARKLPEQVNFRQWVNQLHEAYRAIEPNEQLWHLPDGRALRVVTTPAPDGGVTYLFDDVTERLDLERRYDALIRVQGETLDHLAEAVAVFGSDGRLRLHNPAFARMWRLEAQELAESPHVEDVIARCGPISGRGEVWQMLRTAITALEGREGVAGRFGRTDGSVIDCATVPLPDGATLLTFQDMTDTVNVERVLRERNDALETADRIKNDFVHHVSYELRSPLTSIIGFAQMLNEDAAGPLNERQREYLGYITTSSGALLAIIDDILDLATIDAGSMTLNLGPVDIRRAIDAAAEGVKDRLAEINAALVRQVDPDIGAFLADEKRVRQILFNLLSNAIGFSPVGGTITLSAEKRADAVVFSVTDRGPGIPTDIIDRIFDRFESHALGSRHRGAGLGLSIVRSFVELHGGRVTIDSAVGVGTTVHCIFPLQNVAEQAAAE